MTQESQPWVIVWKMPLYSVTIKMQPLSREARTELLQTLTETLEQEWTRNESTQANEEHRKLIEAAFEERNTITPETAGAELVTAIEAALSGLEHGDLRVAEPVSEGGRSMNG